MTRKTLSLSHPGWRRARLLPATVKGLQPAAESCMDESKGCLPCQAWEEGTKSHGSLPEKTEGTGGGLPAASEAWVLGS